MKLLTFEAGVGPRLGALRDDGTVVDLTADGGTACASMLALIEAGSPGLDVARTTLDRAGVGVDPGSVHWLAPLPVPVQMRDFIAFEEHMQMAGWAGAKLRATWGGPPAPPAPPPVPPIWYEQPLYYKCNRFAAAGSDGVTAWPAWSNLIDYELELACVIGRGGRDIAAGDTAAHIFGFTIFNDLTARDAQFREMQGPLGPAKGKDFDGANVLGPVIVTVDELGPQPALVMRAFVNDECWSDGNSGTIHWSWADIIAHVSRSETLYPGEILGSGTVGGGCGLELGRFLMHDDVIRLEVEGIGVLSTRINAPHVPTRLML